jgi:hypothetical protein
MRWRKHGIVHRPDAGNPWSRSHAMLPTPLVLSRPGIVRVYYTSCDAQGRGRPMFVDFDPDDLTRPVGTSRKPLLDIGRPGCFDDHGVAVSSVVARADGNLLMYYVGFELGVTFRYRLMTGLAVSEDGGETFHRHSEAPLLDRSNTELLFRCGPNVHREGNAYRMWYVAGSRWTSVAGKLVPNYRIMHARSPDGVAWPTAGEEIIAPTGDDEHGIGRPWVVREGGRFGMYYSVRSISHAAYRLGYAESLDGLRWNRLDDELNLHPGPEGFDASAAMYAATVDIRGTTWCFYNGNEFGLDGIALASRER